MRGTFTAVELAPYRAAARKWVNAHAGERVIGATLQRIENRMRGAGPVVEAHNLRGKTPDEKARAVWSRLRSRDVTPEKIAETWLAVWLATAHNPPKAAYREFQRVQTAKAVHRLASGYHRRWVQTFEPRQPHDKPRVVVTEMHKFPASTGRVLRHLGKQLDDACDWLTGRDAEEFMREVAVMRHRGAVR